jgi:hypothetical protein
MGTASRRDYLQIMKLKFTLAVLTTALLLTGCWQKSVYPFFKEKDVFVDDKLIGSWRDAENEEAIWKFEKGEVANVYKLHIEDKETKIDADAQLFKMGEGKFMDLRSRNRGILDMPAHTLLQVLELGETFKLQIVSQGWVRNRLQLHPKEIANVFAGDPEHPEDAEKGEFILTAGTDELQKYVLAHMKEEGFWDKPGELKRAK